MNFFLISFLCAAPLTFWSAHADCLNDAQIHLWKKDYRTAAYYLECARSKDPENVTVLSQLAIARSYQRQYVSAGAAFQLGIIAAMEKSDSLQLKDLLWNRQSLFVQLFNRGVRAERGKSVKLHGSARPTYSGLITKHWGGADAVRDTTVFPDYDGGSPLEESAYFFEAASYVDPTSVEVFQKLTHQLSALGLYEDAIRSANFALELHPADALLSQELQSARKVQKKGSTYR